MPLTSGMAPVPNHPCRCYTGGMASGPCGASRPSSTDSATCTTAMCDVSHCVVCDIRGATCTSNTSTTTKVLICATPSFLAPGPAEFGVGEAGVAVVGEALNFTTATNGNPRPIAVHLVALPDHAKAGVNMRGRGSFATFALLCTAPMLLCRGPGPEKVVKCCVAVEGRRRVHMDGAARFSNGTSPAHVAIHLNLTVSQSTCIPPS
mmetsp:Transcript_41743/g.58081  ORF Transcript_41743/g.58081 Transcript_41743/m.58081 type:complete len:206 (-) Transcript_41743:1532-2149(-)